jgi:very-short-patch-repair endonuclease
VKINEDKITFLIKLGSLRLTLQETSADYREDFMCATVTVIVGVCVLQ